MDQGRRPTCLTCRKPSAHCYCSLVEPFASFPRVVMLGSKRESRRTIATGRLVNRVLSNSLFLEGMDFSQHPVLNELLEGSKGSCALLYPGPKSLDLDTSPWNPAFRTVILLDGTWSEAKRMLRESTNLHGLPRFCFRPKTPSLFLVRKQPHAGCYSTIEAVRTLLNYAGSPEEQTGRLTQVFRALVQKQLGLEVHFKTNRSCGRSNQCPCGSLPGL